MSGVVKYKIYVISQLDLIKIADEKRKNSIYWSFDVSDINVRSKRSADEFVS